MGGGGGEAMGGGAARRVFAICSALTRVNYTYLLTNTSETLED